MSAKSAAFAGLAIAALVPFLFATPSAGPARDAAPGARSPAGPPPADTTGERLFEARCATCHEPDGALAPSPAALADRSAETIVATLTTGSMQAMADGLTAEEIRAIATYLTSGREAANGDRGRDGFCPTADPMRRGDEPWPGWNPDLAGTRFQPDPGFHAADVPRLRVKWAFRYDIQGGAFSQPVVVGGRIFVTSIPGAAYALDAETGCIHWRYETGPGARTMTVGAVASPDAGERHVAFIGDNRSVVHAVDAETGEGVWRHRVEEHPSTRITGTPVLYQGRLYVPVSSQEEGTATDPTYECCTFRGSVVALDAASGERIWKSYTIPDEPRPFGRTVVGTTRRGPAGAAIWSTPTIDPRRGVLYVSTGNSYTDVSEEGSNAILALDLETGERRWANQVTEDDNFIVTCLARAEFRETPSPNCPENVGPDHDFGVSPIVTTLPDGRDAILAGDKGAVVYAMDPDRDGALIWTARVGDGSTLGGIQWGLAVESGRLFAPVSDDRTLPLGSGRPGLVALDIANGSEVWSHRATRLECSWSGLVDACSPGYSAAVASVPGVVFAASLDGHLRAFSTDDGSTLWAFDTARLYHAANGGLGRGGSIDGAGVTIANGMVLVNSGYARFTRRQGGNVLVAFSVDGR